MGGTIEGDAYCLPSAMAELVLRQSGFQATSLGTGIPFESLTRAVESTRPLLFWLSVSHLREGLDFLSQFATLSAACASVGTALVVGGRALVDDLRRQMTYAAYCDNMQHLESFAKVLLRSTSAAGKASKRRRRGARR
jgi:methanogenic corrinoid protein MtbC1